MDIAAVVDERINPADLEALRGIYEQQASRGVPNAIDQFSYAYALIRSTKTNIRIGIFLLQGLINRDTEEVPKRDCVYYIAIAQTRLKEFDMALHNIKQLLSAEADNRQVLELKALVERRKTKDRHVKAAMIAGVAGVAGALIIGALLKKN